MPLTVVQSRIANRQPKELFQQGIVGMRRIIGVLYGANMNITTDNAIPLTLVPEIAAGTAQYIVRGVQVTNASISLTTAAGGVYTAASKGGSAIVAAAQAYSGLTAATKNLDCTLAAVASTDIRTEGTLYLNLTTAQGAAATADIYIWGEILP
jgi:hypothetical protein